MRNRCCCNCGHDIRAEEKDGHIVNHCDIDGHYIGYIECMEGWCPHWKKERKWDHERLDTQSGTV